MVEYNLDWLKKKGFFRKSIPLEVKGKEILVDEKDLLAYVEIFSNEEIEEIKRELLSQKVRYIWFFFPGTGKLKVFRRIGEVKWFYYSARMRSDYLKSRIDKLNKFSPDNMNILFDIRDIVEKFYWQLWEHRILMARSIKELKEDKSKLLAVQHLIDRLIFFYFLAQLKLVKVKNEEREWILDRKNTREFFEWICDQLSESDLQKFLNKIFFDVLGQVKESGFVSEEFVMRKERFSIVSPCLNGGLFIEEKIEGIPEGKIKISGIKKLILEVLNNYNWIIGEELPEEEDVIGDLTPEIIGHIYEKFVVSLEQIGLGKIKLKDVQTVKEELRYGRKKIGAYYTPEEITNYISMNTIYPCIRDKLKEKFGKSGEILLDNLFNKNNFNKQELEIIKHLYFEILTKIKICDNACGSGSFLIAAGDVLLRLYSRVLKILVDNLSDDRDVKEVLNNIRKSPTRNYYIVRQIIVNNLYGVDIMEGAVEIAKLRFWLWLISQVDPRRVERRIETLPNLDFNLMVGNSLIGFVDIGDVEFDFVPAGPKKRWDTLTSKQYLITTWTDKDKVKWLKELAKQKQKFKTLPAHEAIKLKEELNKDLEKAREFLNEKFYSMLKSNGIKISEEEFRDLKPFHWGFEFYEVFDLEKSKEERGFDVIIGNPPYFRLSTLEFTYKSLLKSLYKFSYLESNAFSVFTERSRNLLSHLGYFSYITHKNLFNLDSYSELRKDIIEKNKISLLADAKKDVFVGVTAETVIFILRKSLENGTILFAQRDGESFNVIGRFSQKKYNDLIKSWDYRFIIYAPKSYLIIKKASEQSIPLGKICIIRRGIETGNNKKFLRKEKVGTNWYPVIRGKDIARYFIHGYVFLNYSKKLSNPLYPELLKEEKIVTQQNSMYPMCYYDYGGFYVLNSATFMKVKDEWIDKISSRFLTSILNSRLISYLFMTIFTNRSTLTINILPNNLASIPIKLPPTQQPFIILCNYMLFLNKTEARRKSEKELIEFIDKQIIDPLVYELYFKEKFKQDGIKTNLFELVEPYFKDISNLNSDEQKLQTIKKVVEKIKNDKRVMGQMEKIKSHPWVRVIEGGGECLNGI